MLSEDLSIGELADAAGLSRRAVRFYVQQQLLPAPNGRGRGRHYDVSHLERLQKIAQLQSAGHSLDSIRRILAGKAVEPPVRLARAAPRPGLAAELWTKLKIIDGVELQFDAARHQPDSGKLLALRDAIREAFAPAGQKNAEQ
jgi:DNA-binding transcriptional MerR regulator